MTDLSDRLQDALGDAYRLERELARGGMSQLFLATETSLNRQVVIKLLPPEMASGVSAARFKQEIQLAAHLQHPNILPVLAAGASDDLIYYVIPYVRGESLRHRLTTEGKLPVDDAVRILHEVADALSYAHAHGVVHRDIKPENILLEQGHAVLTDFGVARAVAEARSGGRLTETGMAVGTPAYMSPEQAAGDKHVDARADVYALAVVGYEMLVGASPFSGPSAQAVMVAHLTETPKPVSELREDTPASVTAAIERALAKDPEERLQTAAEFRDAVSPATSVTPAAERPVRRYAVIGALGAVVLAAVIAFWPRGWSIEGDPRKSLVVFPFENRTGDPESDWLQEASMNLLGLSLAHWEDLRVFDDERTASLMRRNDVQGPSDLDFDAAQRMAREARVGTLVMGDIRREGDSLAMEAKVHDVASGDRLATEIVRADLESDPRVLFDSLAARILQVSGAPAGVVPGVVAQTTRSLEAYRAYLEGAEALQRFDLDSAEARLSRALELDSAFALAYIQLRNVEGWRGGGDPERRRALVAKARTHSQALPPRLKLLVEFHSAYENSQLRRARSIAEQLIARDSNDVEAWYQLGEAHYHDGSWAFPHPDTLGNIGHALRAFQQALTLDPSYILAYRHIVDALELCAQAKASHACVRDSAVYGEPGALAQRVGTPTIERLRHEAEEAQVETAYQWVSAAPNSPAALERLVQVLLERERFAEAANQLTLLKDLVPEQRGLAYEAKALTGQRRFAEGAKRMQEALAAVLDQELRDGFATYFGAGVILGSAGLVQEGLTAELRLWDAWAAQRPSWPNTAGEDTPLPKQTWRPLMELAVLAQFSADTANVRRAAMVALETLRAAFGYDSVSYGRLVGRQSAFLSAYLTTRDTTILTRWFLDADSVLWHSAEAQLVLARGDTARARSLLTQHFEPDAAIRIGPWWFHISEDVPDAYAWADLIARLGELRSAIQAYTRLDEAPYSTGFWALANDWGLLIRSYAERGALYQALGNGPKAIEMYQKFIDAWGEGDQTVQPMVERARAALAALRGETAPPERR